MSDNAQSPKTSSLEELRTLRDEFTKAHATAQEKLAEVDKQIKAIELEEWKAKRAEALNQILPNGDKSTLKGHEISFLINNSKEGGHGPESFLGASVAAAHRVHSLVVEANAGDASVAAKFWGGRYVEIMKLDTKFGANAYSTAVTSTKNLLPAAKEILTTNTPDTSGSKHKNYVIICDGSVEGDVAHSVAILEAAAKFNPKATFDFVVCNAGETNIDALVKSWGETASGQKPNLVKVSSPKEIHGAVLNVIKARLSGDAYTPPAATAKTTAPSSAPSP